MNLYGQTYDVALEQFLLSAPRYRLAVIEADATKHEEKALNIGLELAKAIEEMDRSNELLFQFAIQNAIRHIIHANIFNDLVLGESVIIENPGILFEPALGVNVTELLMSISKNTLTILLWPGTIKAEHLYYLSPSSRYYINHSDINYIIL